MIRSMDAIAMKPLALLSDQSTKDVRALARIAVLVMLGDLLTKWVSVVVLGHEQIRFTQQLSLMVVYNNAGAFGWSFGSYTWQITLALTVAAIAVAVPVTRDLAKVDKTAPLALGMIVGGALGNLVSQLTSPAGVVDFISWSYARGHAIVLNGADVAAYCGLALLARTGFRIARQIIAESRAKSAAAIGSAYAHKAAAKRTLRRLEIDRLPVVEDRLVVDWSNVSNTAGGNPISAGSAIEPVQRLSDAEVVWDSPQIRRRPRPASLSDFRDLTPNGE